MTTGRINQVCQLLLRYMQRHVTMVPYGSAAQMQLFASHSKWSPILGTTLLGKRNLPLDTSKLHFSTVKKKALKHKPPAHTQKLCVIKQLHNTQRVSMTTRKLLGSSRRSCHCTHACPSRVHCSNNEASSHLEQSNSPVVNCSGRAVHRGPAEHQTTECSKPSHLSAVGQPSTRQLNARS